MMITKCFWHSRLNLQLQGRYHIPIYGSLGILHTVLDISVGALSFLVICKLLAASATLPCCAHSSDWGIKSTLWKSALLPQVLSRASMQTE